MQMVFNDCDHLVQFSIDLVLLVKTWIAWVQFPNVITIHPKPYKRSLCASPQAKQFTVQFTESVSFGTKYKF